MNDSSEFVSNYSDLSTDRGFQFEFCCNRCSNGFRTRFQPWTVGSVSSVLDAAGSLLGGVFSSATDVGERARSAGWQKAHGEAFGAAIVEVRPNFVQCPRCSNWVCRKSCWNSKRSLCKECGPDLGMEMSAIATSCPNCGAPQATNAKFCPECGTRLKEGLHCPQCGAKPTPGAKFCPECGAKVD
ncbi:MAG: zinc ribbon domain-containing protein [Chloroflexota bacterium]